MNNININDGKWLKFQKELCVCVWGRGDAELIPPGASARHLGNTSPCRLRRTGFGNHGNGLAPPGDQSRHGGGRLSAYRGFSRIAAASTPKSSLAVLRLSSLLLFYFVFPRLAELRAEGIRRTNPILSSSRFWIVFGAGAVRCSQLLAFNEIDPVLLSITML